MKKIFSLLLLTLFFNVNTNAQVNEDQTGGWYMYFWNTEFGESKFGLQGDVQYRNWDVIGDLEQLLLRAGVTYSPNENVKLTLGYGNITSGTFGDSNDTSTESRIYQEALLPHKISSRIYLKHRFRYEQRWVEGQDFRTRYRYNLFLNIPLNQATLNKNALYLAFYNEVFINGQKDIGDGRRVEIFDRNRLYGALGYAIKDNLKVQAGYMEQTLNNHSKGQIQLSLHHSF
ncbi:DUF2490 domain-containing protein [Christiangramia forsetii]|uniref:Secreted protein n=2 Tax=Christiangramia forsetii TaxID=411153 RepID=A0M6Z7_CHRFK|nr:DUF2490 domain-containing protein [Christiangramia forsetii]GGG29089.1 hypothetical protein GCM10011532_10710 [Christiangramia forsetii]CAL68392.1 conserved hypothetical protein, secreted [Christiangramia forsetii KT0803]